MDSTLTLVIPNGASRFCSFRAILEVESTVQVVHSIIDTGFTMSFLIRRVANNLKVKMIPFNASVTSLAKCYATTSNAKLCVTVKSAELPSECPFSLTAALLTSITGDTPSDELHRTFHTSRP